MDATACSNNGITERIYGSAQPVGRKTTEETERGVEKSRRSHASASHCRVEHWHPPQCLASALAFRTLQPRACLTFAHDNSRPPQAINAAMPVASFSKIATTPGTYPAFVSRL